MGNRRQNESLISNALSTNASAIVNNGRVDQSRFLPSLFALSTIDIAKNFQIELGLRQNSSERHGSSFSPSLGVNWAATPNVNVRGSVVALLKIGMNL